MKTIQFYFDFLSPYAYLAHIHLFPIVERYKAKVEFCPVLLAAFLNAHGHKGPAEIAPKRLWVFKESIRRAALAKVDFGLPYTHPFNPLAALRAVVACPPEHRHALCDRFWAEAWGGQATKGLENPSTIAKRAEEAGLDGQKLVERTRDPIIKETLKQRTTEALEAGVFGVPTYRVDEELFWGYDSLDLLELYLAGKDPLNHSLLSQSDQLRPSANRQ